ncbi:hypothetical protein KIN20_000877 [Parelaphostrongylus tenuis]|uniref:Uncharacterized protein n=1 Tax=Parelaphostrongylus tenuis TaxID=148309 RepID=A0AAD5MBV4_PARTN|nr:hypothetical protein KIN20_000877 [Parelaphostrongylus tenuis]
MVEKSVLDTLISIRTGIWQLHKVASNHLKRTISQLHLSSIALSRRSWTVK